MLTRLRPPAWPAIFGIPEPSAVAKGKTLFKDQCESCHASIDRTDLKSEIRIKQTWLSDSETPKTDLAMTCNAYGKRAKTGVLQGTVTPRDPHKLENEAPVRDMVQVTIGGAINNQHWAVMKSIALSFLRLQPDPEVIPFVGGSGSDDTEAVKAFGKAKALSECLQAGRGYKARPLNGIWATAPYLHNGSVPTLYDLLLPADERPKSFYVGSREFDPNKVGFVTTESAENSFLFQTRDASGKIIDGNSNIGHEYGTGLAKSDREAVVAYLKTL